MPGTFPSLAPTEAASTSMRRADLTSVDRIDAMVNFFRTPNSQVTAFSVVEAAESLESLTVTDVEIHERNNLKC